MPCISSKNQRNDVKSIILQLASSFCHFVYHLPSNLASWLELLEQSGPCSTGTTVDCKSQGCFLADLFTLPWVSRFALALGTFRETEVVAVTIKTEAMVPCSARSDRSCRSFQALTSVVYRFDQSNLGQPGSLFKVATIATDFTG